MNLQHFIPISSAKITQDLCKDNNELLKFFNLLKALYQFHSFEKLEKIKPNFNI
jgi:hypothetical protein